MMNALSAAQMPDLENHRKKFLPNQTTIPQRFQLLPSFQKKQFQKALQKQRKNGKQFLLLTLQKILQNQMFLSPLLRKKQQNALLCWAVPMQKAKTV